MRIFTRPLEKLHRVAGKYRCASIVVGAAALAVSSLCGSEPALALDECGALAGGIATCTSSGNFFNSGITYFQTISGDMTVNLQQGVNVDLISNPDAASPGTAVSVSNFISGNAILQDLGATITSTAVHASGVGNAGIVIRADNGSAIVTASGTITLGNSDGENAIVAAAGGGTASVKYAGPNSGPGLIAGGNESQGTQALNFGTGNAIIESSGNVQVSGPSVYGLIAHAGFGVGGVGDATVTYHSGTIDVSGGLTRGILAWVDGTGRLRPPPAPAPSSMSMVRARVFMSFRARPPRRTVRS
jgi:hypothetical protein